MSSKEKKEENGKEMDEDKEKEARHQMQCNKGKQYEKAAAREINAYKTQAQPGEKERAARAAKQKL